jgi:hypothetical protein
MPYPAMSRHPGVFTPWIFSKGGVSMLRAKMLPVDRAEQPFVPCSEVFLSAAEREMAAFVVAAKELNGFEVGQLAAECWLEQLSKMDWSNREGPTLRQVTIAAASQLAKSTAYGTSNGALFSGTTEETGRVSSETTRSFVTFGCRRGGAWISQLSPSRN